MADSDLITLNIGLLWAISILNFLISLGMARRMRGPAPGFDGLGISEQVPEFAATSLEGKRFTTESLTGMITALVFISPDCKSCVAELPKVDRIREGVEGTGVQIILISDGDVPAIRAALGNSALDCLNVAAPYGSKSLFHDFRVSRTPSFYVIDPEGRVAAKGNDFDALESDLKRMLTRPEYRGMARDPTAAT
jgi:peroxiredoxin